MKKIPHSRVFKDEILYFMEKATKKITAKGSCNRGSKLCKIKVMKK